MLELRQSQNLVDRWRLTGPRVIQIALLCALSQLLAGCNRAPATFEDCMLENLKGSKSDRQVVEIRRACSAKFPKQSSQVTAPTVAPDSEVVLGPSEKKLITGRDTHLDGRRLKLVVSNMTEKFHVTQIHLRVETVSATGNRWNVQGIPDTEMHKVNIDLPPRSEMAVNFDLGNPLGRITRETPAVWIAEVRGRYV